MTPEATYALLSVGAYADSRRLDENEAQIPDGWILLPQFTRSSSGANGTPFLDSGFSARVYQRPGGEIVIAHAGTQAGNTEVA